MCHLISYVITVQTSHTNHVKQLKSLHSCLTFSNLLSFALNSTKYVLFFLFFYPTSCILKNSTEVFLVLISQVSFLAKRAQNTLGLLLLLYLSQSFTFVWLFLSLFHSDELPEARVYLFFYCA